MCPSCCFSYGFHFSIYNATSFILFVTYTYNIIQFRCILFYCGVAVEGRSWPGIFIYDIFAKINLTQDTCPLVCDVMNRVVGMLAADKVSVYYTYTFIMCTCIRVLVFFVVCVKVLFVVWGGLNCMLLCLKTHDEIR